MNSDVNCEWCGALLNKSEQPVNTSGFDPISSIKLLFKGAMYLGDFSGSIRVGDPISFTFENRQLSGTVKGLEVNNKLVNSFHGEGVIGVLL
jgi:hypothetical protein